MRGREQFYRYRGLIKSLEVLFRLLPSLVKEIVWTLTDSWRGKAGLVIRYAIAKTSAQSCGEVVYIGPYVEIRNWKYLRFGSNISIQRGCYLDAVGGISIGDNVSVAHGTSILSSNHQWYDPFLPIRDNPVKYEGVDIVGDVWIGCACQIMGGVTINSRAVVAAGAVVVNDVPSAILVGGVPARYLKDIKGVLD